MLDTKKHILNVEDVLSDLYRSSRFLFDRKHSCSGFLPADASNDARAMLLAICVAMLSYSIALLSLPDDRGALLCRIES